MARAMFHRSRDQFAEAVSGAFRHAIAVPIGTRRDPCWKLTSTMERRDVPSADGPLPVASARSRVVSCGPPTGSPARRTHRAEVAQSVEHATENRGVASSILALGTTSAVVEHRAEVAQLVEHHLAKVRVAGSSPVFRSSILPEGPAAPSSSGRTADFGSVNRGSNPRGAASVA